MHCDGFGYLPIYTIRYFQIVHKRNVLFLNECEKTYLNAEEKPRCLVTRSRTRTSFPCSCKRNVFASTSRNIRLKCSLSTRSRWQLFSFSTIVAALYRKMIWLINIIHIGLKIHAYIGFVNNYPKIHCHTNILAHKCILMLTTQFQNRTSKDVRREMNGSSFL